MDDEDSDKKDQGPEDEGSDERDKEEAEEPSSFNRKWNWWYNVEQVAKTVGLNWDEVLERPVVWFLNIMCYIRDRNNWEAAERKKLMKK